MIPTNNSSGLTPVLPPGEESKHTTTNQAPTLAAPKTHPESSLTERIYFCMFDEKKGLEMQIPALIKMYEWYQRDFGKCVIFFHFHHTHIASWTPMQ